MMVPNPEVDEQKGRKLSLISGESNAPSSISASRTNQHSSIRSLHHLKVDNSQLDLSPTKKVKPESQHATSRQ